MLPDCERLPINIYSVAQVRAMDRAAIEEFGIPGYTLMERAAAAALATLRARWPAARSLQIYCGAGNNAGDGYVLARLAAAYGIQVTVIACTPPDALTGDAATAARDCIAAGIAPTEFSASANADRADVIVDALFGTGLTRPLEGLFADALAQIASARCPVFALDIPSGVDADTGNVTGPAVRAHCTMAFVGLKAGYFLGAAPDHCGDIEFSALDIPSEVPARHEPVLQRLGLHDIQDALPPRRRTAHKGDNGRLLVIGGGPAMAGAARMAGEAALRAGAGLVRLATHPGHAAFVAAQVPELIVLEAGDVAALDQAVVDCDAIALGPGLGRTPWASQMCEWALAQPLPLVIDADGLNWLAESGDAQRLSQPGGQQRILTPHAGEAGRLLGCGSAEVQRDRMAAVTRLSAQYNATVVLKGARTLISGSAGGPPRVCLAGNPGMATAGTGDVLTGIAAGALVQTGDVVAAANAAVMIHALAGDSAAAARGERGLLATDLLDEVQRWANPS